MITLDQVRTLLLPTGYTVKFSKDREPDLQEQTDLPIIYLGYLSIDSKNPTSPIEHDFYFQHGEDLVQSISIQIVCTVATYPTIWKTVYSALVGKNPNLLEVHNSGLTYSQGGVQGLSNSKLWTIDIWKIGFPTVNVNF